MKFLRNRTFVPLRRLDWFKFILVALWLSIILAEVSSAKFPKLAKIAELPIISVKIYRVINQETQELQIIYDNSRDKKSDRNITLLSVQNSKNATTTTITEPLAFQYRFECSSSSPIEWIYNGQGFPHVQISNTRELELENLLEISKHKFISTISLYTVDEESGTGNFTCRSVANHSLSSFFYVFVPGPSEFLVDSVLGSSNAKFLLDSQVSDNLVAESDQENSSKRSHISKIFHLKIEVDKTKKPWTILPCSVSKDFFRLRPKSSLLLYRINRTMGLDEWTYLPLNPTNLTYDPRIGFQLLSASIPEPLQNYYYICASNQVKTLLNITLVEKEKKEEAEEEKPKNLDLQLSYDKLTNEFQCVAVAEQGKNFDLLQARLTIEIIPCHSISHCRIVQAGLRNYKYFAKLSRFYDINDENSTNAHWAHSYEVEDNTTENSSLLRVKTKAIGYNFMSSGLIYCSLLGNSFEEHQAADAALLFYKLRKGFYALNFRNDEFLIDDSTKLLPAKDDLISLGMLDSEEYHSDDYDKNETGLISLYCEGSKFFLAEPFVWKFWSSNEGSNSQFGKMSSHENGIIRSTISEEFMVISSYVRIECMAPVWNSHEWVHETTAVQDLLAKSGSSALLSSSSSTSWVAAVILTIQLLFIFE